LGKHRASTDTQNAHHASISAVVVGAAIAFSPESRIMAPDVVVVSANFRALQGPKKDIQ
jgi:hypothetical protein